MLWSILAAALGAVVGAGVGDEYGALSGAFIGWLLSRSMQQARRIESLEKAIATNAPVATNAATESLAVASVATVVEPAQRSVPAAAAPAPPVAAPPAPTPHRAVAALAAPRAAAPAADPASPTIPPRDILAPVKAWLFGGNTIVKAGVGILFVGLAFLAKFAGEHITVPIELRLAAIAAVAVALLALGWTLRRRRPGYAQVLQGGAVAVLYLTLFVAFRYYGVLSAAPVFALMVAVAALSAALAVLQDARALAVIGALGGFATPLLVSTGSGNHVALFSYYLVLDLGIAAVAWFRNWRLLTVIGFAGTFIVATAWGVLRYEDANRASSQAFLIAFFLLFVAVMLLPARKPAAPHDRADAWLDGSLLFGLPTITFVLQYGLVRHTEYGAAIAALVLGGFYVALAAWMQRQPRLRTAFEASLAIATVFLTLVIPFALDARSTAGAWALEGAGLVWLGWRQQRRLARAFGYALLVIAGGVLSGAHLRLDAPAQWLNAAFFNAVLIGAAALAAARFVQRARTPSHESLAEPWLIAWGTLWLLYAVNVEVDLLAAPGTAVQAWIAGVSLLALLYAALAARLRWPGIAWPAAAQAPFLALCLLPMLMLLVNPLRHGGAWAWPLALAAHAVVLRWAAPHWPAPLRHAGHALGPLLLAALGALLGRVWTGPWGDPGSAWPWLGWLAVPAALLWLLPSLRSRWPVSAEPAAYRSTAPALLAAGLLLWSVVANLASTGSARPLPYVPLLNPLDLGIGLALAGAWRWWRSDGAAPLAARAPALGPAALGACAFVWADAMLLRSFHHHGGVPYDLDAWIASSPVQTGLTLLWTVIALALMWLSTRRVSRAVWMVGAVLLGMVVLKLLLVDQAGSGTVARIVSFIGVGVLMLVIGYVAPLPARKEDARAAT